LKESAKDEFFSHNHVQTIFIKYLNSSVLCTPMAQYIGYVMLIHGLTG